MVTNWSTIIKILIAWLFHGWRKEKTMKAFTEVSPTSYTLLIIILTTITKLFNTSIQTGVIPETWKLSSIVPIPKGSKHTSVSNYRPISLLLILSKLLERHVHSLITVTDHLDENYPIAFGTMGVQTTEIDSVWSTRYSAYSWSQAIDQSKEVCAVFFDLQKAFNSVPHKALIDKLESKLFSVAVGLLISVE